MQMLYEMDGFASNDGVLVVGATNRVSLLDDALLRKGRFDLTIYMGRPSTSNRFKILQARALALFAWRARINWCKWPWLTERSHLHRTFAPLQAYHVARARSCVLDEVVRSIAKASGRPSWLSSSSASDQAGMQAVQKMSSSDPDSALTLCRCTPRTRRSRGAGTRCGRATRCCTARPSSPSAWPALTWPTSSTRPLSSWSAPFYTPNCGLSIFPASANDSHCRPTVAHSRRWFSRAAASSSKREVRNKAD